MIQTKQKTYSKGIKISHFRNFINWLEQQQISLGLITYQSSCLTHFVLRCEGKRQEEVGTGTSFSSNKYGSNYPLSYGARFDWGLKCPCQIQPTSNFLLPSSFSLMLIGVNKQGSFSRFERIFQGAMGLYATPDRLYLSSRYQLWQMDHIVRLRQLYKAYDKLYVLRIGTDDIDIHDIAVDNSGEVIFVSTLLNYLAKVRAKNSCTPLWKLPFISKVINQGRCHLNGVALGEEKSAYVNACIQSDVVDGWHQKGRNGGCVVDVASNQFIFTGLSMAHSPGWYRDKFWLCKLFTDYFCYIRSEYF